MSSADTALPSRTSVPSDTLRPVAAKPNARLIAGLILVAAVSIFQVYARTASAQTKPSLPLPSWQDDGQAKRNILKFVQAVTQPGPQYVRPEERIATFDLDGTLWTEQPELPKAPSCGTC